MKTKVTKSMTEKDIMRVWVDEDDVGNNTYKVHDGGHTAEQGERAQKQLNLRLKAEEAVQANKRQVGGDHYKNMGVEPWDVVDTWPIEQRIGAYRHGALKYLMRMGSKDENLQEIKKAGHYIEKLIEVLEERDNGTD